MRRATVAMIMALGAVGLWAGGPQAAAEGDAARGRKAYELWCIGCHGDKQRIESVGPSLVGLLGRRAGTVDGSPYSRNLYQANIVWDERSLDRYLAAPTGAVHGTIMPVGLQDARERADVIAYLKTLK
ncbi:MAG TPA: c-type cytochrome [Burkholderiales bacterium]|jgi:cytochrome c|nr:c-type cytochrome [Burkholderiales bacterium]